MIKKEGSGWRIIRDSSRDNFSALIGGETWAIELNKFEWENLVSAVNDLSVQYIDIKSNIIWVDTEKLEIKKNLDTEFKDIHGILIPGGFGNRGIEGKVLCAQYAREKKIPFFGICLGMQCAVIEYARNVCKLKSANSTEFDDKTTHPVIDIMHDQKDVTRKGATMRLGSYSCDIKEESLIYESYKNIKINERHRHRYEFNNKYLEEMESKGLIIGGVNKKLDLVETIELKNHPWYVGVQFHPELKSRLMNVHPLFDSFIKSVSKYYNDL